MARNSSNPDFRLTNSNSGSFPLTSQRTFLGSSISKFNVTAGFGDTTSTLGVDLVDDLRNNADNTELGLGQDVYHGPNGDQFSPPPVGSPVFFSFGKGYPTVTQSFIKQYDDTYGTSEANPDAVGYNDFAFGGILQTYNQTRSSGGDPLYSVQVKDPREILANTEIILRNYAGSVFNTPNMFNVYGFLEYNPSPTFRNLMAGSQLDILQRFDYGNGDIKYNGTDMYYGIEAALDGDGLTYAESLGWSNIPEYDSVPNLFPITGTGMSRVGPQGIPYYRIIQALNAMMGFNSQLPSEYVDAGFNTVINFRGFNYIVDFSGVPLINQFYYFDYDRMSLLDFVQEICEITSHELFVSLLPIIDHPKVGGFYSYNQSQGAKPEDMIFGIIRIDTIDKKAAQVPGRIKQYIDDTYDAGIVTQTDIGVELANVVTDKFIAGAQETEMHFFSTADDRTEESQQSWSLQTALRQQALPYYGRLKSGAVTIPKGHGAYQQILLDASELYAEGVGEYYVATELELRAADISFERWSEFLMSYNSVYLESLEDDDTEDAALLQGTQAGPGADPVAISKAYGVSVPRCLWANPNMAYGEDQLPVDACFPPYGYPLYYKRGERIGLNGAGFGDINASYIRIIETIAQIKNSNPDKIGTTIKNVWQSIEDASQSYNGKRTKAEKEFIEYIKLKFLEIESGGEVDKNAVMSLLSKVASGLKTSVALGNQKSQYLLKNAKKIYAFVSKIAKENLGRKFLVKIPTDVNPYYEPVARRRGTLLYGPYGFKPFPLNNDPRVLDDPVFQNEVSGERSLGQGSSTMKSMLDRDYGINTNGKYSNNLVVNYNPITNAFVSNYVPSSQGGWMPFELFQAGNNNAITQGLFPVDSQCVSNKSSRRTSCYVRFDNSQELSFGTMQRNLFTQQVVYGNQFVPDVNYQLDNTNPNKIPDGISPDDPAKSGPKSVAFVKAQIDAELYFAPQMTVKSTIVHGRDVKETLQDSLPRKLNVCGEEKDSFIVRKSVFSPLPPSDGYMSNVEVIIDGSPSNLALLDRDNVYALVTLPARVRPEVDSQLRDGQLQAYNAEEIKHYLGQDVVRGVDGFDKPGVKGTPQTMPDRQDLEPLSLTAKQAVRQARANLAFALPNAIKFSSPSPVYPDLFVLPLESQEKAYGPWSSSTIGDNVNIGGDVEYEKDESLAPWNYGGFELMNQAGLLKAEYSNSLMLASERGAFTIPDYPKGISLGKFLVQGGPLVTNINVQVSNGGITTGYTMDLYTASFGKLQKQKEKAIAKIDRERQKSLDERNSNLRKGISKAQADTRAADAIKALEEQTLSEISAQANPQDSWSTPTISSPATTTVVSAVPNPTVEREVAEGDPLSEAGPEVTNPGYEITGALLPDKSIGEINDKFDDPSQAGQSAYLSASSDTVDDTTGYTESPRHKVFPPTPVQSSDILRQVYGDGFDADIS